MNYKLFVSLLLVVFTWIVTTGFVQTDFTNVRVEVVNPRYSLSEAIQIAITQLEGLGKEVNLIAVERILRKMGKGDVVLPSSKGDLRDSIRSALQIHQSGARQKRVAETPVPTPTAFGKYTQFEAAWVSYKMSLLSRAEVRRMERTMEGVKGYKKKIKKEAQQIWTSR